MPEQNLIELINSFLKGKIFRQAKDDKEAYLFLGEQDEETFVAHNLTEGSRQLIEPFKLFDSSNMFFYHLCQISSKELTPDEAYNLAHYEREKDLEQTASAQTPPSCIPTQLTPQEKYQRFLQQGAKLLTA